MLKIDLSIIKIENKKKEEFTASLSDISEAHYKSPSHLYNFHY